MQEGAVADLALFLLHLRIAKPYGREKNIGNSMIKDLQELYDKLIAEGCNRFCIEGIGEQLFDDVDRLSFSEGIGEVHYMERGQKSELIFSADKDTAIKFYHDHILKFRHTHLIACTRSLDLVNTLNQKLDNAALKTVRNDIPSFNSRRDYVYRLFVINKDIFKAREVLSDVPYIDKGLED